MNEEETQNPMVNEPQINNNEKIAPKESPKLSMPVAIVLAGVIIAFGIIISGKGLNLKLHKGGSKINIKNPNEDRALNPLNKNEHIRGDLSKAKVAIVEFSDLQCPYCKQIHPALQQITTVYGSDVVWVYRHFPLESIHPRARPSAHASECVTELAGNDGFWKFVDSIFAHTGKDDPLTDENLLKYATLAGADGTAFTACQTSGKHDSKIDDYLQDSENAGAAGTPDVTVIDLKTMEAVHVGADPSLLAQVIDKMLK